MSASETGAPDPPASRTSPSRSRSAEEETSVQLWLGDAAWPRLEDDGFIGEWTDLAGRAPGATLFQHPAYCLPWFRAYRRRYEPVLVTARQGGELVGLMALGTADGRVCHAGDHQCEYQGWLASGPLQSAFAAAAIDAVFERLEPDDWRWDNLAPELPTDWARECRAPGGVAVETTACPLLDARDEEFIQARMKGRLRNYRNRLRRRGLRYERVTDPRAAAGLLDRLAVWCDLRQGAVHGTMPFRDDPAKHEFHRFLLEDPAHFWISALWLENEPIAAHVGPFDGTELALGVQGYDAREAKLSPGTILLFELARDVAASGGRTLDLTPGGDAWKERYASHHREITSLVFHRRRAISLARSATRGLEDGARAALRGLGAEPARVKETLRSIAGGGGRRIPPPPELLGPPTDRSRRSDPRPEAGERPETERSPENDRRPETGRRDDTPMGAAELELRLRDHGAGLEEGTDDFLGTTGGCLADGWRPVAVAEPDAPGLGALAWLSPTDSWIDLTDPAAPRARGGEPKEQDVHLPDDVTLIRVDSPAGWLPEDEPEAFLERLMALADNDGRVRLLASAADLPRLRALGWRPVRVAARAS